MISRNCDQLYRKSFVRKIVMRSLNCIVLFALFGVALSTPLTSTVLPDPDILNNNNGSIALEPTAGKVELREATFCDSEMCKLPNCRCATTILNETIPSNEIPQVIGI